MPRLLVAISAHGLGHLGQAAPVCNALAVLCPELQLTIWSTLAERTLRQRIAVPFVHVNEACDIGFVMHDAMHVDIPASWQKYEHRERHWSAFLDAACTLVRHCRPDLILSDVGEMPLAAGRALSVPTIAMSSLNWADMAGFYFDGISASAAVLDRLGALYDNATLALRLSPGLPMRGQHERILPPVGAVSTHAQEVIDQRLMADVPYPGRPRILVGLGGIRTDLPLTNWPRQSALNLLVANQQHLPALGDPERGIVNADTLRIRHGWNFCDLLAGCHAVICKPGYGTFVEAALAGISVLYVPRPDWPEQPVLTEWLQHNARCVQLSATDLYRGHFLDAFEAVMTQTRRPPVTRDGATIAAREILALLD